MMKTIFVSFITFVFGFGLAWYLYPSLNPGALATSEESAVFSAHDSEEQFGDDKPINSVINANRESIGNTSNIAEELKAAIKQNQIDFVVETFNRLDLDQPNNRALFSHLEQHILNQIKLERYNLAQKWLDSLLGQGFNQITLHLLKARVSEASDALENAIEHLYLAKYFSITPKEVDVTQKEIEDFIKRKVQRYNSKQLHKTALISLLDFAREKQAEHPLFNIEYAKIQFAQGESQRALETLSIIPYSEEYQDEIERLQNLWTTHLQNIAVKENGMPLEKAGSHFIVEVDIDNTDTLRMILDTGASISAINESATYRLLQNNLIEDTGKALYLNTANGSRNVQLYKAEQFTVNGFTLSSLNLASIDMENNANIDGLLGMDFLGAFKFEIDYENRLLYLKPNL